MLNLQQPVELGTALKAGTAIVSIVIGWMLLDSKVDAKADREDVVSLIATVETNTQNKADKGEVELLRQAMAHEKETALDRHRQIMSALTDIKRDLESKQDKKP